MSAKTIGGEEEPLLWRKTYDTEEAATCSGDELWHMTLAHLSTCTITPALPDTWPSELLSEEASNLEPLYTVDSCIYCHMMINESKVEKRGGGTESWARVLQSEWTKDTSPCHTVMTPRHWPTLTQPYVTGPPIGGPVMSPLYILVIGRGEWSMWWWRD